MNLIKKLKAIKHYKIKLILVISIVSIVGLICGTDSLLQNQINFLSEELFLS